MNPSTNFDVLVVGQGLAGTLLAWKLMQHGQRVLVVDNNHRTAASRTAAGLINPVTGMRLVKTERVEECLPVARETYRTLEQLLNRKLLFEIPMLRLIRNPAEKSAWEKRFGDPAYRPFLGERLAENTCPHGLIAPEGGFIQLQTGYMDTCALMDGFHDHLQEAGAYSADEFVHRDLEITEQGVNWRGRYAERAIFCEGYRGMHNPWFGWLPFQPAKGEILSLEIAEHLPRYIINAGRWLMPRGDGSYRLGATYDRQQLDEESTPEGRRTLLAALGELFLNPPQARLADHRAGVRPNTLDKRPFIGMHPERSGIGIFNGFGSKGSLLMPWYADRFAAYLLEQRPLPEECDILRYWKDGKQ